MDGIALGAVLKEQSPLLIHTQMHRIRRDPSPEYQRIAATTVANERILPIPQVEDERAIIPPIPRGT